MQLSNKISHKHWMYERICCIAVTRNSLQSFVCVKNASWRWVGLCNIILCSWWACECYIWFRESLKNPKCQSGWTVISAFQFRFRMWQNFWLGFQGQKWRIRKSYLRCQMEQKTSFNPRIHLSIHPSIPPSTADPGKGHRSGWSLPSILGQRQGTPWTSRQLIQSWNLWLKKNLNVQRIDPWSRLDGKEKVNESNIMIALDLFSIDSPPFFVMCDAEMAEVFF